MNQFQKMTNSSLMFFLIFIFSIILIFSKLKPLYENIVLHQSQTQQVDENADEIKSLTEENNRVSSDENKEKYFREQYKISEDGEILFSFPPEDE